MCGRFALSARPTTVRDLLDAVEIDDFPPRYNIAPTQPILVVSARKRPVPGSNLPPRAGCLVRWGLIPSWVKDPGEFTLIINARSETAIEKASFRAAMRHRRVLIPASGYYEWHRPGKDSGQKPQAYWIRPKTGGLVCFGGLMETCSLANGSQIDTGCLLTTSANASLSALHDRMPVIIDRQDFDRWLDCRSGEPRDVQDLMRPAADGLLEAIPVSDLVNKVSNFGPDVQKPVALAKAQDHKGQDPIAQDPMAQDTRTQTKKEDAQLRLL